MFNDFACGLAFVGFCFFVAIVLCKAAVDFTNACDRSRGEWRE